MKNETLYNKTVDILVQAYLNDTLIHGNCFACAVGNMVASNMGFQFVVDNSTNHNPHRLGWGEGYFYSSNNIKPTWFDMCGPYGGLEYESPKALEQIKSTGYSFEELIRIERAFEVSDRGNSKDEYMFNGLMAVIEVLDQIHENTDTVITETTKRKFNKVVAS